MRRPVVWGMTPRPLQPPGHTELTDVTGCRGRVPCPSTRRCQKMPGKVQPLFQVVVRRHSATGRT